MGRRPNLTKLEIIEAGTRMFLENGYTNTSVKAISDELKISTGNLTFYFPTKEHLLLELVKNLTGFYSEKIQKNLKNGQEKLFIYCGKIAEQIALCEVNPQAKDLFVAIYSLPIPLTYMKDWSAKINQELLEERLSDWSLEHFQKVENIVSGIERSALADPCTETYPLADKIKVTLDSLLKIYDVSSEERAAVIGEILKTDYCSAGQEMFQQFIEYTKQLNQEAFRDVLKRYIP